MIIVCTGGRDYSDQPMVFETLDRLNPKTIYVGDCPTGADALVAEWAEDQEVSIVVYHADWKKHGKAAGPIRNGNMLDEAGEESLVIAFKGGRGTADCVRQAVQKNMIVLEVKA